MVEATTLQNIGLGNLSWTVRLDYLEKRRAYLTSTKNKEFTRPQAGQISNMHYDHQHQHRSAPSIHKSTTMPTSQDTTFTSFRNLPAEIRTMIWEYSLPSSRVYEILDAPKATQRTNPVAGLMFANIHQEPPPALSAVCRESRYFVLHHYKPLTLGLTTKYVDLSRDILLLEPYLQIKRLHRTLHFMAQIPLMRDNINRLALGTSFGVYTGICHPVVNCKSAKTNVPKLLAGLRRFPRLMTVIFIVHQEFQFEFDTRPGGMIGDQHHHHAPLHPGTGTVWTGGNPIFMSTGGQLRGGPLPATLIPLSLPTGNHQQQRQTQTPMSGHPPVRQIGIPPPDPPQQVHAAYRFKFDIETDINRTPRRPHVNSLLYYPLEYDEEGEDEFDIDLNDLAEDDEEEEGEWCDPWPTNDDWRRFKRRWVKAVRLGLREEERKGERERDGCGGGGGGGRKVAEKREWDEFREGKGEREDAGNKKVKLSVPALKGASLLWRYTRGGYV